MPSNKWRHKRSVMRRYDLTANIYDERYGEEQKAKYKAALQGLHFSVDSRVLDAGCGSGMFFDYIAEKACTVVGVDTSGKLLRLAIQRAKAYPNIALVQADVDYLPFRKHIFSHIFAFTVLQNMFNSLQTALSLRSVAMNDACYVLTALKAAVDLEQLGAVLDTAGMHVASLYDDEALKCHIVFAVARW